MMTSPQKKKTISLFEETATTLIPIVHPQVGQTQHCRLFFCRINIIEFNSQPANFPVSVYQHSTTLQKQFWLIKYWIYIIDLYRYQRQESGHATGDNIRSKSVQTTSSK